MAVKETPAHSEPADSAWAKSAEPAAAAGDAQGTRWLDPAAAAASRGEPSELGEALLPAPMSNLDRAVCANA